MVLIEIISDLTTFDEGKKMAVDRKVMEVKLMNNLMSVSYNSNCVNSMYYLVSIHFYIDRIH